MPDAQEKTRTPRLSLLLLIAAGLIRFVNLGFLDLQAWDEALYAVRAETISRFGLFFDQSPRAIDGLYSALHPPLYVWLTALSFEAFGISEFSARFFSALFGALTLFVIYRTGILLRNERTGLIAALLYGLSPVVLFYSRQGQFDATLVFFLSWSVYLLIRAIKEGSPLLAMSSGLIVGGSLMTKLFVGAGIPLTMIIWMFFGKAHRGKTQLALLGMLCIGAILVAAPWHIYMSVIHGDGDPLFFLSASSLFERTFTGVEGNIKELGPLYFVNQLLVLFPLGVFWFFYSLPSALKRSEPSWLVIGLWFSVFFVVFSLMRTQLEVYILPILVPASLLAARSFDRALAQEIRYKTVIVLLASTTLAAAWSASQVWRNAAKVALAALAELSLPSGSDIDLLKHLALIIVMTIAAATLLWNKPLPQHVARLLVPAHLVPLAVLGAVSVGYLDQSRYNDGASELAGFMRTERIQHVIVAGYERNPQLSYYLSGADLGWDSGLTFERIIPPSSEREFKEWLAKQLSDVGGGILVVLEKDKFLRYKKISPQLIMPPSFMPVFDSRRYSAWVRKPYDTLASIGERNLPE